MDGSWIILFIFTRNVKGMDHLSIYLEDNDSFFNKPDYRIISII